MNTSTFGIWPPYEAFYIHSMLFNTTSAMASIEVVSDMVERVSESNGQNLGLDLQEILNELQNIVLQAAAVSRYFWPARKGHEARAERLRAVFEIDDTSPLKSRELRNAMEHFDEKLDAYLAEGIVGHIFPQYVGRSPRSDGIPQHFFRAFYIDTGIFELLGERYEMQPIVDELCLVHDHLYFCSSNGDRLQPLAGSEEE